MIQLGDEILFSTFIHVCFYFGGKKTGGGTGARTKVLKIHTKKHLYTRYIYMSVNFYNPGPACLKGE